MISSKYSKYHNEWAVLYKNGNSCREISDIYKCNVKTVLRIIRNLGIVRNVSEIAALRPSDYYKSKYDKYYDEWVELYKVGNSVDSIAKMYRCPQRSVYNILLPSGILRHATKYTNCYNEWIELYKSGRSTLYISRKYNCSVHAVSEVIKTSGIIRSRSDTCKNTHNFKYGNYDTYFDTIDTEEKAYYLGIILADGCIYEKHDKQSTLSLGLTISDGYIVDRLAKILGRNSYTCHHKNHVNGSREVRVGSEHICNTLREYGITPRKSTDTHEAKIFNHIPDSLMNHFIRGVIDGDGSIGIYDNNGHTTLAARIFICGNFNDMRSITDIFHRIGCRMRPVTKHSNIYSVKWSAKLDVIKIIHYLYDNSTIYLDRKYRKAMDILAMYDGKNNTGGGTI